MNHLPYNRLTFHVHLADNSHTMLSLIFSGKIKEKYFGMSPTLVVTGASG